MKSIGLLIDEEIRGCICDIRKSLTGGTDETKGDRGGCASVPDVCGADVANGGLLDSERDGEPGDSDAAGDGLRPVFIDDAEVTELWQKIQEKKSDVVVVRRPVK